VGSCPASVRSLCRIASFAVTRISGGSLASAALELGFETDLHA
jgi:hypothetical protein